MSRLAIIPARGGSKRISRKNIKDFLGKPIIAYSIQTALKSNLFDEVMVSTDDHDIAEIAVSYGAKVPFIRSEKNANDFINDYKNKLARSLVIIITTIDPEAIVFGGGLSNEIDFLDETKKITSNLINEPNLKTIFLKPLFGDASGVRGAALLGKNTSI